MTDATLAATGGQSPRICYVVRSFPEISEAFIAYSFSAVSEKTSASLLALRQSSGQAGHPVLRNPAFMNVRYVQRHKDRLRSLALLPHVVLAHGLNADGLLAVRFLGYQRMAHAARIVSSCLSVLHAMRPDIIHVYSAGMAVLAQVLSSELNVPYTVRVQGSDIRRERRYHNVDQALRMAHAVICPSRDFVAILRDRLCVNPCRVHVIPNGVDTQRFRPHRETQADHLVAVGRLHQVKGFDVLIEAVAILIHGGRRVSLDIIGEGCERSRLEGLVEQHGLCDCIRLPGALTHDALPAAWSRACLGVMPSREEGFANVAAEAMACGVPIVASRVGGLQELISEATGYLCEPNNPRALADAIEQALRAPHELRDKGVRARDHILHNFSWARHAEQLMELWSRCRMRPQTACPVMEGS